MISASERCQKLIACDARHLDQQRICGSEKWVEQDPTAQATAMTAGDTWGNGTTRADALTLERTICSAKGGEQPTSSAPMVMTRYRIKVTTAPRRTHPH
jgi:hypothetical protein